MDSNEPIMKKHKKHKKDRGYGGGAAATTPAIKLILKVGGGGSSTPEHSDSPGPMSMSVMNPYADDSQHSSVSLSSHNKKKKKDKKKDRKKDKKDKKHKHHHKEKKRLKEERKEEMMEESSVDVESAAEVNKDNASLPLPQLKQDQEQEQNPTLQPSETQEVDVAQKEPIINKPAKKFFDKQPFQKLLDYLLRTLEKKDAHQFFAWPVTDKIAPGYSSIIKKPMDFRTMKMKIESYSTLTEFSEDFKLMCNNAMIYNQPETIYYKAAKKLLQSGLRILSPEKIKSLLPLIPSIRVLTEEHLGSPLFPDSINESITELNNSEDEANLLDLICLDPTQSIHYVPPHPNDPPDVCGAFTDDLTTEEVLLQARLAAREAAHRLATKKPNSKMGFLRQREDGSTSLSILTPTNAVLPGTRELPVSLGALSGKLAHGTTQVHSFKEDKRHLQRPVKPVNYGAFSSFAPSQDSTFSNLTTDESEIVSTTYGDETAVQYAESMIEFAKGCDYAMHMVDEILDTITKGEHRKTVNFIEERKRVEEEEARVRKQQEELTNQLEMEWQQHFEPIDQNHQLHSLSELGINTQFLNEFNSVGASKLQETAELISDLEKAQNERLVQPGYPFPPYVPPISDLESQLATRITTNLTEMAKQTTPGELINPQAIRKVMGIDINNSYSPPQQVGLQQAASTEAN